MRRLITAIVAGALVWAGAAAAHTNTNFTARVAVDIATSVSGGLAGGAAVGAGALAGTVNGPTGLQIGAFDVTVPWRVDANTQKVKLGTAVTSLYKAEDPFSAYKIPVDTLPVDVTIKNEGTFVGTPTTGSDLKLTLPVTAAADTAGWDWWITDYDEYQSSARGTFSHSVDMKYHWKYNDAQLPAGQYSGFVKLYIYTETDPAYPTLVMGLN